MALVLDAVDSPHTYRAYRRALTDFLTWHQAQGTPAFTKALLQRYRAYMLDEGIGASSINQRLAAIKKLVHEAADNQAPWTRRSPPVLTTCRVQNRKGNAWATG